MSSSSFLSASISLSTCFLALLGSLAPGAEALSDDALDDFIRTKVESAYHPCGTCRMGTDALAVVDPECRVIGVQNLRVVDAGIMPQATAGDLNGPTIMLAERGADIIRNKCLPEVVDAPLMVASDWRHMQRNATVAEDFKGRRSELREILMADLTM